MCWSRWQAYSSVREAKGTLAEDEPFFAAGRCLSRFGLTRAATQPEDFGSSFRYAQSASSSSSGRIAFLSVRQREEADEGLLCPEVSSPSEKAASWDGVGETGGGVDMARGHLVRRIPTRRRTGRERCESVCCLWAKDTRNYESMWLARGPQRNRIEKPAARRNIT